MISERSVYQIYIYVVLGHLHPSRFIDLTPFQAEIDACIEKMSDDNKLMRSEDTIFVIWILIFDIFHLHWVLIINRASKHNKLAPWCDMVKVLCIYTASTCVSWNIDVNSVNWTLKIKLLFHHVTCHCPQKGPCRDLFGVLGPYSYFRVPIFSVLTSFTWRMSIQSVYNNELSWSVCDE